MHRGILALVLGLAVSIPAQGTAQGQEGGGSGVTGTVLAAESGAPINNAAVFVVGTSRTALTDREGRFRIAGLSAGTHELIVERLGYASERVQVTVTGGAMTFVSIQLREQAISMAEVLVTSTREAKDLSEIAASVGVVGREAIAETHAGHPSEIMGRIPGVWVNVTGGEGHMTAIRQPKTTNPVYLYLEDGVPTRSTGFFNHNALYEVNVPQSSRIEVMKGPVSALYGSDAIGATVNVSTRAPANDGISGSVEGGSHGFGRLLASLGMLNGANGVRADVNVTRTDGWRDGTDYNRQSGTLRWDRQLSDASSLRTVATFSHIDQSTAGSSAISEDDYRNDPTINYTPISYRRIKALRLSSAYERMGTSTLFTVTPFVRWNQMDILPNWSLTYDPGTWDTGNASAGALVKLRRDFAPLRARVIAGADLDYSPGWHREMTIQPTREGGIFTEYTAGEQIYDYDVTFSGISPYVQAEISPIESLRVTAGLRFDHLAYTYDDKLGELQTGRHRRPASTDVSYDSWSPKLGITFAPVDAFSVFGAYGHGFRAPSEGQLFRQGSALNTVGLSPVKADNIEGGVRGRVGRFNYDASAYRMEKTDDILSLTNPDGSTEASNAGKTLHRGIELAAGAALPAGFRLDVAFSFAEHTYEDWRPREGVDFSGNEMEDAPRQIGNVTLGWMAAPDGPGFALEWARIGKYWMDAANTTRYPGHDLLSIRADVPVTGNVSLFGRLANITDERYAESAAYTTARGEEYAPGMPRTFYLGVQVR